LFHDGSQQFVDGDFAEDIGEDFFGFRELGLDREYGLATLSVPFHLLQNRMRNALDSSNTKYAILSLPTLLTCSSAASLIGDIMTEPDSYEPVTVDTIQREIALVHDYFLTKIGPNTDRALVEDDDLPPKQRFPKPRLPPTGKITSPRKRPIREQQMLAKKRRRLEEEGREGMMMNGIGSASASLLSKPLNSIKLDHSQAANSVSDMEKDDDAPGIISPPNST
jgi:transcriptional activator SPT7